MEQLTEDSYKNAIAEGESVVKFGATWCGPCRVVEPILKDISENREDVPVYDVDVDRNNAAAAEFGIRSVPTIIFFRDGEPVDKILGARPKAEIEAFIDKNVTNETT